MQTERPTHLIDPVCGMTVDVVGEEGAGLLVEYKGRTFAFCRAGCRRAFTEEPGPYLAQVEERAALATVEQPVGLPVIDQGMRVLYESCACRLSDAFPEIKVQLDAELAGAGADPAAHELGALPAG